VPAPAALNWAAVLTCRQKYTEALEVLSRIDGSIRKKPLADALDTVACVLLADILSVINGLHDLTRLRLTRRCRLLKAASLGVLPFLHMLKAAGRILTRLRFPDGPLIQKLGENTRQLCWAYGMPTKPGFIKEHVPLEGLKGYESSHEVYRKVFLGYLDCWMSSEVDLTNFLIGSVKPGDAHALYCLVREKQPSVVLEVGTFIGFSASIIAHALRDNGKGIIHCVDPNIKFFATQAPLTHAQRMLNTLNVDGYVRIHEGFFSEPRENYHPSSSVLGRKIADLVPPVDLAFIDGDHETTAALQDFMLLLPHLNHNATVVFHDIRSWPTVRQAITTVFQDDVWKNQMCYYELSPSGYDGLGVIEVNRSSAK
jgi:predicted O-methyltransferase YrrM